MQRLLGLILVTGLVGCASHTPAPVATPEPQEAAYTFPASALVFDPTNEPALDLSREGRQPAAFGGFQQATTSFSYVRTDDRQNTGWDNGYDRRSITVQIGTSVR